MLSISLGLLARFHLGAGQADAAAVAAELARDQARHIGYREGELSALNLQGRALLVHGNSREAQDCFTRALSSALAIEHRGAVCEALESLALSAVSSGRHEEAYLLLAASNRERDRTGLHLPGYDAEAITTANQVCAQALDGRTAIIEARARLLRFDSLVEEVLRGHRVTAPTHRP
jgi:hypothetical protein